MTAGVSGTGEPGIAVAGAPLSTPYTNRPELPTVKEGQPDSPTARQPDVKRLGAACPAPAVGDTDTHTGSSAASSARPSTHARKASGRPRLARFVSFVFLLLAGFVLPQQAAAQNSGEFAGSTFTIADAEPVDEGGTARFTVTVQPALPGNFGIVIQYTPVTADLVDLGSDRPPTLAINSTDTSYTIEVPIAADGIAEGEETFTVRLAISGNVAIQATGTINASAATTVAPAITTQPTNQSVTVGENATFTVAATGIPTPTYQWRKDGSDISGATSASYTISNAAEADAGDYTVVVTNTAASVTSTAATLTVTAAAAPDLTVDDVSVSSASVLTGASFTINATVNNEGNGASAATTLTYHRSINATITALDPSIATDAVGALAANGSSPENTSVSISSAGTYWVGACVTAVSNESNTDNNCSTGVQVVVTAAVAPQITTQPTNRSVTVGGSATFTVVATGTPTPTYQWRKDGSDISGATSASYTLSNAALTNAGSYTVVVTNSAGTVTSTAATLTVTAAAPDVNTITIGNRSVAENVSGGSVGFTVSLTRAVDSDVTLAVAYTAGTASLDDDLGTPLPPSVTITEGNTSATLAVPIANEVLVEGDETFTVTLSEDPANPLPEGVEIGNGVATGTITNDDEAEIRTNVSEVNETGVSLTFRPGVTAPLAQDLALAWEVTGGTASAADFSQYVSSGTVTIPARQNSAPIFFFPRDDDLVEGSETLTLTFSPAPGTTLPDGVTFRRTTATATIRDSDEAVIDLRVVADVSETDERLTFRPVLNRRLTQDVTVSWEVTGGTASAEDFSEYVGSGTVTIEAGRGGAPIRFFPLDDDAVEGDETLEVTISAAPGTLPRGVNLGATTTATATIADDDEAPVVNATVGIDDASVAENGGNAEFTVSLTAAVTGDVVLDVIYEGSGDNPAELARDLGAGRPPTVTIEEGQTSATLLAPVNNDALVEGDETFTVTIRERPANPLPDGVTIDGGTATGTIVDNETGQVTLGPPTLTAAENGGTFSYTVNLSAAADDAVVVRWTAAAGPGDTATVDDDLRETTGTVTFAARNNRAQEFTIRPVDDLDDEVDETFTVTLEVDGDNPLPTGVTIGSSNSSTATITDDDEAPAVTATVGIDDESVVENVAGGTVTFTAALTAAVDSPVVLAVEVTAGTATLGVDLGTDLPTTVTIDRGQTEATFTVPITDDNIVEGNETFTVTLSESDATDLPDGVTIRDGTATGTITENDEAEVTLTADTATANENGGTFSYTVNLSAAADEPVVVRWTATDGTAIVTDDLQETTDTVTFAANDNTAQTFTIRPVNDNEDEDNETFTVTLGPDTEGNNPLPTGVTIGAGNSSEATIIDDDDALPPENARVNIADMTATENAGAIGFTVTLSRAVDSGVTLAVAYTAGSADPGTDLGTPLPPTVTIPEGETRVTLSLPVIDDVIAESTETFTVTLSADPANPLPDDVSIGDGVATGTITDNDEEPGTTTGIRIADAAPVAEDGTARFTITLEPRALTGDAVLDVAYAPGTATGGTQPALPEEDLGAERQATVRIPAGRRSVVLEVPIADDDAVESRESFTVTLSAAAEQPDDPETGLPPAFVLLFPDGNEATGIITDNDEAAPPASKLSVLIEPRLIGAGTALRRHVGRFESLTGTVARNRLEARETRRLSGSKDLGSGAVAVGGGFDQGRWGAWIDGAWAGFGGNASGRQADVYGGFDFLGGNGKWLIGALIGYEAADLEIGEAAYRADYTHFGIYGGARLSETLLFDGAATYGTATPDIALGNVSASYDAYRITARGALTGDFGLEYGLLIGSMKIEPQLGVLYSRETLGAFTDSAGGVAGRDILELGRLSAGPRLTWGFDGGRVAGGARVQWDFLQLDDGVDGRISGAADIGVTLDLTPRVTLGVQGDVDGIGVSDEFGSLGGKVEIKARF